MNEITNFESLLLLTLNDQNLKNKQYGTFFSING